MTELSPALVARLEARLRRRTGPALTIEQVLETALTWALNKMGEPESTEPPAMRVSFSVEAIAPTPTEPEAPLYTEPLPTEHSLLKIDLQGIWGQAQAWLLQKVGQDTFDVWFKTIRLMAYEAGYAMVHGANPVFVDVFKEKRLDVIAGEAIAAVTGERVTVLIEVSPDYEKRIEQHNASKVLSIIEQTAQEKTRLMHRERLKALLGSGTPENAKEARELLLADEQLLDSCPHFMRKQLESWLEGSAYQAGKEAEFRGRKVATEKQWGNPPVKNRT